MSPTRILRALPLLVAVFPITGAAAEQAANCQEQAVRVVERLQAEVVGELSVEQQSGARSIVAEACQARSADSPSAPEQAAQQTADEVQSKSGFWSSGPADKPGNKRLERRGRY